MESRAPSRMCGAPRPYVYAAHGRASRDVGCEESEESAAAEPTNARSSARGRRTSAPACARRRELQDRERVVSPFQQRDKYKTCYFRQVRKNERCQVHTLYNSGHIGDCGFFVQSLSHAIGAAHFSEVPDRRRGRQQHAARHTQMGHQRKVEKSITQVKESRQAANLLFGHCLAQSCCAQDEVRICRRPPAVPLAAFDTWLLAPLMQLCAMLYVCACARFPVARYLNRRQAPTRSSTSSEAL